jgi:hypothetical protein
VDQIDTNRLVWTSLIPRKRMSSAGARGVREYGGLFWCPRFDEFREQFGLNERSAAAGYLRDLLVRFSGKRPDDL